MSSNAEETDPGFKTKAKTAALKAKEAAKRATEATDPWADRLLESAKASSYSVWIIVAIVLVLIVFGAWVAR